MDYSGRGGATDLAQKSWPKKFTNQLGAVKILTMGGRRGGKKKRHVSNQTLGTT